MRLLFLSLLLLFISPLNGSGLFVYESVSDEIGLASAGWSAKADSASTAFTNPAGMVRLKPISMQIGAGASYSRIQFKPNQKTAIPGKNGTALPWQGSGSLFYTEQVSDRVFVGLSALSYCNMRVNYGDKWVGRYYVTQAALQGFSFVPSAAMAITDSFSLGIGINQMYLLDSQTTAVDNSLDQKSSDGKFRISDRKWRTGYIVGALYQFSKNTRLGIQYLSRVKYHFNDTPKFSHLGSLTRSSVELSQFSTRRSHIHTQIPQSVIISLYHSLSTSFAIMADIGWQQWSKFHNVLVSLGPQATSNRTLKKKYDDGWHCALGMEYRVNKLLKYTFGTAFDSSICTKHQRTPNMPVGAQFRIGAGVEYTVHTGGILSLQYSRIQMPDLKVEINDGGGMGRLSGNFKHPTIHTAQLSYSISF